LEVLNSVRQLSDDGEHIATCRHWKDGAMSPAFTILLPSRLGKLGKDLGRNSIVVYYGIREFTAADGQKRSTFEVTQLNQCFYSIQ
jgi:hypothetical protein